MCILIYIYPYISNIYIYITFTQLYKLLSITNVRNRDKEAVYASWEVWHHRVYIYIYTDKYSHTHKFIYMDI